MRLRESARLCVLLALGGVLSERAKPEPAPPTHAECVELLQSGLCNQTVVQRVASAGSPLLRPLPFYSLGAVLEAKDAQMLSAWGAFKEMGNYDLCISEPDSHHCIIHAFGGPSLGTCLPSKCSAADYMRLFACDELFLDEGANATAALLPPALRNATALLRLLAGTLDYLAAKSTTKCADSVTHAMGPGARATLGVLVALACAVATATFVNAMCGCLTPVPKAIASQWDAIANSRRLLAARASGDLDFLNGVRVLSTGYVVLGHLFLLCVFNAKNAVPAVGSYLSSFEVTLIVGAFSAVDTFFWLSGVLAALALLNQAERAARTHGPSQPLALPPVLGVGAPAREASPAGEAVGCLADVDGAPAEVWVVTFASALRQTGLALVHRVTRLTPVYAAVLFTYAWLFPLVGSGPMWASVQVDPWDDLCKTSWWANLLYVNNLVGGGAVAGAGGAGGGNVGTGGCMGWTWYLANDFQFFAGAALVLPWYPRAPRTVVACLFAAVALSIVATAALSAQHNMGITTFGAAYASLVYFKPHTRCGAYAVGSLFGVFIHERRRRRRAERDLAALRGGVETEPPRTWPELVVALSSGLLLAAVFLLPWTDIKEGGLFDPRRALWPQWQHDLYNALQRPAFAAGLCGLAHWCMRRGGGVVRELLAAPVWAPLAKLSYGA